MSKAHEPHRVDASALHKLGLLCTLLLILILCVMYVLWQHVHPWTLSMRALRIPPPPRLQVAAPAERGAHDLMQSRQLETYGWVDRNHRTAHIPIERAMALLASQKRAGASVHPEQGSSR